MFETLGLEITPQAAALWFGAAIGLCFGALAQVTQFCLRRALVGPLAERADARTEILGHDHQNVGPLVGRVRRQGVG